MIGPAIPDTLAESPAGTAIRRLRRDELPEDAESLARWLIGKLVMRALPGGIAAGRIVETEAYLPGDAAAHSYRGITPRNRSLFRAPGYAYVYRAYGTAWMLNVSAEPEGIGGGVLIRALQPIAGLDLMRQARQAGSPGTVPDRDLARGPGRLAAALGIDRSLDGIDLTAPGPLWLAEDGATPGAVGASVRIGITKDAHRTLRFFARSSPFVSGPRNLSV